MSQIFPVCHGAEFALIHFTLEFTEDFSLSLEAMLNMRAALQSAGRHLVGMECCVDSRENHAHSELFEPPLPDDPVAIRLFQKPSPFFAFLPDVGLPSRICAGEHFEISATFWGKGIQQIGQLAQVFQGMGNKGFNREQGFFELMEMESEDLAGNRFSIWTEGKTFEKLAPAINSVDLWLEQFHPSRGYVSLDFKTPTRLISRGKPLFQPTFARIFPFILRRVTSMLYHSCHLELEMDYKEVIKLADLLQERMNRLVWEDWKVIGGNRELGGFRGEIILEGEEINSFTWVLKLGSLMNIGKGAAYGAGSYEINNL